MDNHKLMFRQSSELRERSIKFIQEYFPDLLGDIQEYAKDQKVNPGDIAALTIKDIILPVLKEGGNKC